MDETLKQTMRLKKSKTNES